MNVNESVNAMVNSITNSMAESFKLVYPEHMRAKENNELMTQRSSVP